MIYGARYHTAVVHEVREEQREILIPLAGPGFGPGFGMPGGPVMGGPDEPGMPGGAEGLPPGEAQGFIKKKVTQHLQVDKIVAEMSLNREVSFGGVALADDGHLRQTYSGRPPSLCPT